MDKTKLGAVEGRFADLIWANEPMTTAALVALAKQELDWRSGAGRPRLHHAGGADGPQGRGCGESAAGGDHPPEPEEDGEVTCISL